MAEQYTRAVGLAARLLLVVVLALGVFVMHTVGHPGADSGAGMVHSSHETGTGTMPSGHGHHTDATTDTGPPTAMAAVAPYAVPAPTGAVAPPDAPGEAMDMASLCVAILGTWAMAALLHGVFMGRRGRLAEFAAEVLTAVRPDPPPRAPALAQLSVLRI
ncbi:hypothetical protein [Streptomyces sp. NPDC048560]|uniref:hypothetical protein n=1 Tax=Streptomyces sp. NPDC048560 TaxID=3155488 RepID=UPI00342FD121